jgi:glycosyltransferase involved in cell wall biosynthesis
LRILLSIHHELKPNTGAPGSTIALGKAFRAFGHEVRYLSFDDMPGWLPERAAVLAFPHFAAAGIRHEARRGLDVVDASTGDAWVWASLTRNVRRPLLVTRTHGLEHLAVERMIEHAKRDGRRHRLRYHLYHGGWRLYEVARSLRVADLVLVLNEEERAYMIERLGIAPDRIRFTANGVPDWYLKAARSTNVIAGNTAIASVGAYRPMKGVEYGSGALVSVMNAHPELTVSFVGTGIPRELVLSDFPAALHDRITTAQDYRREDLPALLDGHGIMLLPSLTEGFPVSLLEGMACGLAPIATRIAGALRLVSDQRNGLLVPLYDSSAITAAIQRLLGDSTFLRRLQGEARRTASEFSWSSVGAQTLDVYREALERRQPAGSRR